jgi:hypothetical protein
LLQHQGIARFGISYEQEKKIAAVVSALETKFLQIAAPFSAQLL